MTARTHKFMEKAVVFLGLVIGLAILVKNIRFGEVGQERKIIQTSPIQQQTGSASPTIGAIPTKEREKVILLAAPFTSQAPNGEWSNPIFQDGCEEASALMVYCAIRESECKLVGSKIDPKFARQELVKMAEWQKTNFGSAVDTSAEDTGKRILGQYLDIEYRISASGATNIETKEEIIKELMSGNLVIVPMNGKKLFNPNFSNGGPERHNVLVRGYDPVKREFITNDPGTRLGEKYRYKEEVFYNAIRDYPSGDHAPINFLERRIIVVFTGPETI